MRVRLGTRRSKLAMAQSIYIKERLESLWKGLTVDIVGITTKGDKMLRFSLSEIGGKGVFVKDIEKALMEGAVDIAVHSMKDVPSELERGLSIAVIPEREDPRDAFVGGRFSSIEDLPKGARVGTSSLRRTSQLKSLRPDIEVVPIRGNLDTRIRKIEELGLSGIVCAVAGLKRLGLFHLASFIFGLDELVPAVGQGALALEIREGDKEILRVVEPLLDEKSYAEVMEEREYSRLLGGGCEVPLGGACVLNDNKKVFYGFLGSRDGRRFLKRVKTFSEKEPAGRSVAEDMLSSGGREILEEIFG